MITAIADPKAALSLSVYFETTKRLLDEAIAERDAALLRRANIKMMDDRFEELPIESQRELTMKFGQAMAATGAFQP
jgi:hypothetical protein